MSFNLGQKNCPSVSAAQSGFTLIQLSILLTIAALVLVVMLPGTQSKLTAATLSQTKMNNVFAALRTYELANGTLPCPADGTVAMGNSGFGVAVGNSGSTGNCNNSLAGVPVDITDHIATGIIPVKTLGLPVDAAIDGYGRFITYAVDTNATGTTSTGCWPSAALLPVTSGTSEPQMTVTDNFVTQQQNAVVVLVSHGADGHGAWIPTPGTGAAGTGSRLNAGYSCSGYPAISISPGCTDVDQLTNAHVDLSFTAQTTLTNFVKKQQTVYFDDIVMYASPSYALNMIPAAIQNAVEVTPPPAGVYLPGQAMPFTLTFPNTVTYSGGSSNPSLTLNFMGNSHSVPTTTASGAGSSLAFSYTPVAGDASTVGITPLVNLNGGSMTVANNNACFIYFVPPNLSQVIASPPPGIALDSLGYFWIADTNNDRFQRCTSGGGCGVYGYTVQGNGSGVPVLKNPAGVGVDSSNNLYIADTSNSRIMQYNRSGSYSFITSVSLGAPGSAAGQFTAPTGLVVDSSNNIWVVDSANNQMQKCTSMTAAGCTVYKPTGAGAFSYPTGMGYDKNNNFIYVADTGNNRIQQFTMSGTATTTFGAGVNYFNGVGTTCGALSRPAGVAADSSGNIWVSDTGNNRILMFTSNGATCTQYGNGSGTAVGSFINPAGMVFDGSNNLWVVDANNSRIEELQYNGGLYNLYAAFGTAGSSQTTGANQFSF